MKRWELMVKTGPKNFQFWSVSVQRLDEQNYVENRFFNYELFFNSSWYFKSAILL